MPEGACRDENELTEHILEAVPAGVVHVGADGSILRANGFACQILGLSYDELTRRYTRDFDTETLLEDGRPCPVAEYPVTRALATGEPQPPMTIGVRRPDGELAWAIFTALPVRAPASARVTGAVVTFLDITARRRAEEALRNSEALLRSVVQSVPDIILTADRDGKILFMNHTLPELRLEDVIGQSIYRYLRPEELPRVKRIVEGVMASGRPDSYQTSITDEVGGRVFGVQVGPLKDADHIVGVTMVAHDLTEVRQLQLRLSVADRMASLGQLAASVGHEINNPLTYVLASLDKIRRELDRPEPIRREDIGPHIDAAIEGTERIGAVVGDLGSLSRAGDSEQRLIDVRPLLDSALRMAHNELRCRARVIKEYGEVPRVLGNDARLGQVFLNLIINGAQAIAEGDVEGNELRVVARTDERGACVVEVQDTGAGIPADLLDQVFEPFVTTKAPGRGTGLGLYICRGIVASLGGDIHVDSTPGRGSTFRVVIPGAAGEAAAPAGEEMPAPAEPRLRVLVVDDEPLIGRALKIMLEDHAVTIAPSGREALGVLARQEFDLVICDLLMPDVTGMDMYEQLVRDGNLHQERIAFMSGGALTERVRRFVERHADRMLAKPFSGEDLSRVIAVIRR